MSKRSISVLKAWFETQDTPTEQQFHDWLDSFWHKDGGLIITSFETLVGGDVRITLSDGQSFTVIAEVEAAAPKIVIIDDALVHKKAGNVDYSNVQIGDKIHRYPADDRYIVARVEALPYTLDANLKFFINQYIEI